MFSLTEQSKENDDGGGDKTTKRPFFHERVFSGGFIIASLLMLPICVQTCDIVVRILPDRTNPQSFTMQKDQKICFEDSSERIPILLTDLIRKTRYQLAYYTAEYELSSCTVPQPCLQEKETLFVDKGTSCFLTRKQYDNTTQNTCEECKDKSGGNCAQYTLAEKKGELFSVWRKISEYSDLKFSVKELNAPRRIESINLACDSPWMNSRNAMTLTINNATSEKLVPNSMIRYKDAFYYIESSESGRPESGKFGDYQVNIDNGKTLFTNSKNPCEAPMTCPCNCTVQQESMVRSFLSGIENYKQPDGAVNMSKNYTLVDVTESPSTSTAQVILKSEAIEILIRQIRCRGGLLDSVPRQQKIAQTTGSSQNGGPQEKHILLATFLLFIMFAILGCLICTRTGRNCLLVCYICKKCNCCCSSDSDSDRPGGNKSDSDCCEGCFIPVSGGGGGGDGERDSDGCCDCNGNGGGRDSDGCCDCDGTGGGNAGDDGCCDCDGTGGGNAGDDCCGGGGGGDDCSCDCS